MMAGMADGAKERAQPLATVLRAIEDAGIPARARKRLQYVAIEKALYVEGRGESTASEDDAIRLFEEVMAAASRAAGKRFEKATEVRDWLAKEKGRPDLARRMRRLACARNNIAHPEIRLLRELEDIEKQFACDWHRLDAEDASMDTETRSADEHCEEQEHELLQTGKRETMHNCGRPFIQLAAGEREGQLFPRLHV